uniref:CRAL-TRIO domain-containing protein n=1 Tax=Alexandrium catenella TaxID=2925 RepID=A0A7S1QQP2_ALECA|mmetsp:Transcript_37040/g.100215  ORF Transcript_37040/g.100215 Transcript_37040/m.100215 type:complete len:330 (+) Transcript_37040:3-992(+)
MSLGSSLRPGRVRARVLRIFRKGDKASSSAPRRRGAALFPALLLAAAAALFLARWRRGLTGPPRESPRSGRPEVNQSLPSCRAAALGPQPSKEQLIEAGRPLPRYMLKAVGGDESQALRRWADTLRWRCDIGDEAIMSRPHPNFARIAPHYPTFLHLPDREGHMTYWELIGAINQNAMLSQGLTSADIIEHYIWSTLFTWDIAARDDADEVTIIVDMAGFGLSTLTPTVLGIFYRVAKLLRKHFPERENGMYFINAPSWSEQAFNTVAPLVSQKQRNKVRLFGVEATPALLRSLFVPENLPREYGGEGPSLGSSEIEQRKRRLAETGKL